MHFQKYHEETSLDTEFRDRQGGLFLKPDNNSNSTIHVLSPPQAIPLGNSKHEPNGGCMDAISRWCIKGKEDINRLVNIDHKLKVFLIQQRNSYSRLQVDAGLFDYLCDGLAIFGNIKEFALSFGIKVREDEIGPPPCRFRRHEDLDDPSLQFDECAYGLRFVERKNRGEKTEQWSVRQTAVYCRYNPANSTETWLFLAASHAMEQKIEAHIKQASNTNRRDPFQLHLALIQVAITNWRWYIKSLVETTNEKTSRIVGATMAIATDNDGSSLSYIRSFVVEDRQQLKVVEDRALDLVVIFESMLDTIETLLHHRSLACKSESSVVTDDAIIFGLKDHRREVELYYKRAQTLQKKVQGASQLLSDLLNHENAKQSHMNGLSLKSLAEEARSENVIMRRLSEKSAKDAGSVKAITVITMVYLPTSVVASFFSTQFVFQDEATGSPRLSVTDNWWICIAISVPLTVVTIAAWCIWIYVPWTKLGNKTHRHHRSKENIDSEGVEICG